MSEYRNRYLEEYTQAIIDGQIVNLCPSNRVRDGSIFAASPMNKQERKSQNIEFDSFTSEEIVAEW